MFCNELHKLAEHVNYLLLSGFAWIARIAGISQGIFDSPTNQIFISLSEDEYNRLSQQVEFSFWEKTANGQIVVRLATSWATTDKNVEKLMDVLAECSTNR